MSSATRKKVTENAIERGGFIIVEVVGREFRVR